jgi:outer membrane protein OmpA-like peptidoglycan-associated protein
VNQQGNKHIMSTNHPIDGAAWAAFRRWFYVIALALAALLALLWLMGYGPGGAHCKLPTATTAAPAATATAAVPAATVVAPPPAAPAASAAPTKATQPASMPKAVVYFGLDKFDLPAGTDQTLAEVVAHLKTHGDSKVHLSGFHDPSGNQAHNNELALNRARAVRSAIEAAGIARERVVMDKPQVTTGTGEPREARRVEASVK